MRRTIDNPIIIGVGLLVALLVINGGLTYRNAWQLREDARWVAHTHEVLDLTGDVLMALVDAESGQRGFLITGQDEFLQPYDAALARLDGLLSNLKVKNTDNPGQQARIQKLEELIAVRLGFLKQGIDLRRKSAEEVAAFIAARKLGKAQMDAIRLHVKEMEQVEADLLQDRQRRTDTAYQVAVIAGLLTPVLGLVAVGAFVWLLNRSLRARQKAAAVLAEQKERLRTTLASIGDGVISTDASGHVTFLNAVAETLTGWKNDEATGVRLTQMFRIVNESTRQTVENPVTRALKEGIIVGLANHTVLIAKDGTERPIDDSAAPIRCQDGEIVGCVLVFRDITERHKAEVALRHREERFHRTVNEIAVPTLLHADDDQILLVNKAWTDITGYRIEDIPTMGEWTHRAYGERAATAKEYIDRLFEADERLDNGEWVVTTATGDQRVWHFFSTPVGREADGRRLLVSNAIDITERKRAEEQIRYSEQLHRIAFDQSPVGKVFVGPDDRFIKVNAVMCEITGYSADELQGMKFSELTHPDDLTHDNELLDIFRCGGSTHYENDKRYMCKDGSIRWVAVTARMVNDAAGRPLHSVCVIRDITQRKQAEDALRSSEEFNRSLMDGSADCVKVLDVDGHLLYINAPGRCWMGIDDFGPLCGQEWSALWPAEARQDIERAVATARSGSSYSFQAFCPTAKGTPRWWDVVVSPVRDAADGQVVRLLSVSRDISERKQAEKELRASEERMRLATEATQVGIWEWKVLTNTIRWDAQMFRIYGIAPTPDGIVDYTDWSSAVLPEDLAENEAILQDTVRRCGKSERTFRIHRRNDGECRYVEAVETVRTNAQGQAEWVVGTNLDITDRKRSEEELHRLAAELSEADRRKDEFLATLAHELRNPLAPIRNGLQILRLSSGNSEAAEKVRDIMERQLGQMVHLVDDLLDVSRISRGKLELRKERIELASVLNNAVETSRPLIDAGGHNITVVLPPQPVFLDADATRLGQVFSNLLNNSAKYSERGGRIQLVAELQGDNVFVRIKDTGVGIPAEMLPKIFEMFIQVDRSLEKAQGGLGIGLCLVKRLVEMHGGSVEARSAGPGQGSEFVVRLPVVVSVLQQVKPPTDDEESISPSGRCRILVADDNVDSANSLSLLLTLMGNEVRTVHDGLQAVDIAEVFRPDMILLDIGMPKLNGYEACRHIREQPWAQQAVLIALTGWGQDEDKRRSKEAGFNHHLVKPVDPATLKKLLAELQSKVGQAVPDRSGTA